MPSAGPPRSRVRPAASDLEYTRMPGPPGGGRFVRSAEYEANATDRPSAEIAGLKLVRADGLPSGRLLTNRVGPPSIDRTKTFPSPAVSSATRLRACESNATSRPSP